MMPEPGLFCIVQAGFFPTYTLGEDMALALEIQKAGWKGAYVKEYLAVGEVPETVRNAFMQKSRWCKGGMQIFFSKHNAILAPNISPMQKVCQHHPCTNSEVYLLKMHAGGHCWPAAYHYGCSMLLHYCQPTAIELSRPSSCPGRQGMPQQLTEHCIIASLLKPAAHCLMRRARRTDNSMQASWHSCLLSFMTLQPC